MVPLFLSGKQIVCTRMLFETRLLWDECFKKAFIDAIGTVKETQGFEVYAFAVFSDRIYMLSGKFGAYTQADACEDQRSILKCFLSLGSVSGPDVEQFRRGSGPLLTFCPLSSRTDLLKALIYIHLAAQNLGYVRSGFDYWWSSIQTYRNRYSFSGVDTKTVFSVISPDADRARRILIRRHHDAVRKGNPVPECLLSPAVSASPGHPEDARQERIEVS